MRPAPSSRHGRKFSQRNRGAIAVLAAFLTIILLAMVAFAVDVGYIAVAKTELQRAADAAALAAAAQLPDQSAAVDAAVASSRENQTGVTPLIDPADVECGYWDRDAGTFAVPASGQSASAVRVTIRRTDASGNPLKLFFGRLLGRDAADVIATATAMKDSGLCGAFIGIESVNVTGDMHTDSYDSSEGPYEESTAHEHGSLCSDGPITLNGGVYIQGDVRAGRDAEATVHGASGIVTGSIGNRVKPLSMPQVDFSQVAIHNDNGLLSTATGGKKKGGKGKTSDGQMSPLDNQRDFTLNGSTNFTLPPGTYYFNNMELSGQSVLNITGETVIYLTGELKRAGGTLVNNNTQLASNLRIFSSGGAMDITSDNNFYAVIYAPNSAVDLDGTADFFGAIVARTLEINGVAQAHYDESLKLGEIELPSRVTLVD